MPPRKEPDPPQTHLTNREIELLSTALHCTKTPLQIDYRLLSAHAAFKTPTSAKSSWCALKRKLDRIVLDGGAAVSLKQCRHRPRCSKEDAEFCVNGVVPDLRIEGAEVEGGKKGRGRAKRRKVVEEAEDVEMVEGNEVGALRMARGFASDQGSARGVTKLPALLRSSRNTSWIPSRMAEEDEDDEEEAIPVARLGSYERGVKKEQEPSRPESVRASGMNAAWLPTRMAAEDDEDVEEEALPAPRLGYYARSVKKEQKGGLGLGSVRDSRKSVAFFPGRVVDEDQDDEEEAIPVARMTHYGMGVMKEEEDDQEGGLMRG